MDQPTIRIGSRVQYWSKRGPKGHVGIVEKIVTTETAEGKVISVTVEWSLPHGSGYDCNSPPSDTTMQALVVMTPNEIDALYPQQKLPAEHF